MHMTKNIIEIKLYNILDMTQKWTSARPDRKENVEF